MRSKKVSNRYARALCQACLDKGNLDKIYPDLKALKGLIDHSDHFQKFLNNPAIPSKTRQTILEEIFEGKIDAFILRFILFLERKKRISFLKDVLETFEEFYLKEKNTLKVTFITPWELLKEELQSVRKTLESKFNKSILINEKIDPSILGGFKICIHDTILDYTMASQLQKFKHNVMLS